MLKFINNLMRTFSVSYPITSAIVFVDFSLWNTWQAKRIATGCLVMIPRYLHIHSSVEQLLYHYWELKS